MICVLFNRATRKRQSSWKSGIEETSRSTLSPTNTGGGSGRTTPLEGILREVSHYHWCHCGPSRRPQDLNLAGTRLQHMAGGNVDRFNSGEHGLETAGRRRPLNGKV